MKGFALAQARWFVLRFLLGERCFSPSGHQITEDTVIRHVSREFRDKDRKAVKKAISQLITSNLVKDKDKRYGRHLWLNPERMNEISEILAKAPV